MIVYKKVILISFFTVSYVLYSMDAPKKSLSEIEKQLLIEEVKKRGKINLLNEINQIKKVNQKEPHSKMFYDAKADVFYFHASAPALLKLERFFSLEDTDPLARMVFSKVQETENMRYSPISIPNTTHDSLETKSAYKMGQFTYYKWIDVSDSTIAPKLKVKSRFVEKEQLVTFLQNYNPEDSNQ